MDNQHNQNNAADGRSGSTVGLERRTFLAWWAKNHMKFPELSKEAWAAIEDGFYEVAKAVRSNVKTEGRD